MKTCVICGKEFDATKYPHKLTCSRECSRARQHQQQLEFYYQKKKLPKPEAQPDPKIKLLPENICHNCEKEFTPAYKGEKFCSDKCRFQYFGLEEWITF